MTKESAKVYTWVGWYGSPWSYWNELSGCKRRYCTFGWHKNAARPSPRTTSAAASGLLRRCSSGMAQILEQFAIRKCLVDGQIARACTCGWGHRIWFAAAMFPWHLDFAAGRISQIVGHGGKRMLVKFSNLINRESTLNSWPSFIKFAWAWKHCGLSAAPSQERHAWTWQKDVPTYFSRLIAGTQQSSEPSPRKSTAARPQRRRAWADVEETSCLNSCSKLIKRHDIEWHHIT